MASWRGKALLVFKPNSAHLIVGGDDVLSQVLPQIQVETLSQDVGCIAPQTIVQAEGAIVWMSQRGPYFFDGTGARALGAAKVQAILDAIPVDRRRKMVGYYDSKDRYYEVFFTRDDYIYGNKWSLRYSFITKAWALMKYARGIGSVVEVKDSDQEVKVLYGYDDIPALFTADATVVRAKTGFRDGVSDDIQAEIKFQITTGFDSYGSETLDKTLERFALEGEWYDPILVNFNVDGRINLDLTQALTYDPPTGNKGYVGRQTRGRISGKRIQRIIAGGGILGQTDLTSMVSQLTPETERTR
jgi:hypothetical protein